MFKFILVLMFVSGPAYSDTYKSRGCNSCHGSGGISANNMWPNLNGQNKGYLIKQLKDFRSNKRTDPIMNGQAANLTDDQIEAMAAWLSKL